MEPRITRDYQVDIIAYVLPGDLSNAKPPVTIGTRELFKIYPVVTREGNFDESLQLCD